MQHLMEEQTVVDIYWELMKGSIMLMDYLQPTQKCLCDCCSFEENHKFDQCNLVYRTQDLS